jgi:hypothetical protein
MTTLDEGSARCRDLYFDNTQHSQETDTHAPGGIRIRNSSKRAATELRLSHHGHGAELEVDIKKEKTL